MLVKPPELSIDEKSPFRNDKLSRSESATLLTDLIKSYDGTAVIALNSKWGTGKSTFIKMWSQYLKFDHGYKTIYLNAWANDYNNEVLPFLISEIGSGIDLYRTGDSKNITVEGLKEAGKYLLKMTSGSAVKLLTQGLVDIDKDHESVLGGIAENIANQQIDDYLNARNQIMEFKEKLQLSVNEISPDKPLVLFVDELDRCRPLFAIEVLEKIKHFFNVDNIIFVIAIDKQQLGYSVGSVYGDKIDAEGYLRRFFDVEFKFPSVSHKDYIDYLIEKYGVRNQFNHDTKECLTKLSSLFDLDLRTIGQLFSLLVISLRVTRHGNDYYGDQFFLLVFLLVLKVGDEGVYVKYTKNKDSDSVIKLLSELDNSWLYHDKLGIFLLASIITAVRRGQECHAYNEKLIQVQPGYESIEHEFTSQSQYMIIGQSISQQVNNNMCGYINAVVDKIELIGNFTIDS